jgi:hypothetical protein
VEIDFCLLLLLMVMLDSNKEAYYALMDLNGTEMKGRSPRPSIGNQKFLPTK